MGGAITIRVARRSELREIQQIENVADLVFRRVGMPWVLGMQPAGLALLERERRRGWLLVAADGANRALGFALLTTLAGEAYLYQLSVLPRVAGRGFGSALLEAACVAARAADYPTVLLSTYAGVPWNAPFYQKRGFRIVPLASYTPTMRDNRHTELRLG
ncbi:MAG TPA: GNAT family N-acetyltransferase, partial [Vineibacter sp.]|nr:GNAT family N-acetyltransferase [Vineibacter sp.]